MQLWIRANFRNHRLLLAIVVAILLLTGCMLPGRRAPVTPAGPLDAPAVPAASPTVPATGTPLPTLASGPCTNADEFLADDTIPDGTVVEPGAPLDTSSISTTRSGGMWISE